MLQQENNQERAPGHTQRLVDPAPAAAVLFPLAGQLLQAAAGGGQGLLLALELTAAQDIGQ